MTETVKVWFFDTVQHTIYCVNLFPTYFTCQDTLPMMQPQHACSFVNYYIYTGYPKMFYLF